MHSVEKQRTPADMSRHPSPNESLFGRSASVPVANIVGGTALLVRTLRPDIVTCFVSRTRVSVLQRLAPVIGRNLRRLEIRSVPTICFAGRRCHERLKTFRSRGIITHRDSIRGERGAH